MAEEVRDRAGDVGPAEAQLLEALKLGNGGLDWSGKIGLLVKLKCFKIRQVTDLGRNLTGESPGEEGEGVDAVCGGVTGDRVPVTAVCLWVP